MSLGVTSEQFKFIDEKKYRASKKSKNQNTKPYALGTTSSSVWEVNYYGTL